MQHHPSTCRHTQLGVRDQPSAQPDVWRNQILDKACCRHGHRRRYSQKVLKKVSRGAGVEAPTSEHGPTGRPHRKELS
jgi:hypothetical protein